MPADHRLICLPGVPSVTIHNPFPIRVHADEWKAEEHVREWVRRFRLVTTDAAADHFDQAEFGRFAARIKPDAIDIRTIAEWVSWLFLVDDQFDDAGDPASQAQAVDRFVAELRAVLPVDLGPTPMPTCPGTAAAADMWPHTAPPMSRSWRIRFIDHICDYIDLYREEIAYQRYTTPPTADEYIPYRRIIGAADPTFDLIEVAEEFSLDPAVFDSRIYQQMRLAGNDIACWTNDILSLAKEAARGDLNNLVAVLQHQDKLSLEQALNKTATMINSRVGTYVRLRDEFTNSFHVFKLPVNDWYKTVSAVHGLGTWVAGSLDWHLLSGRYTHIEHTEPGQHPSYFEPVTPPVTQQARTSPAPA
ncbi:hypothetical protein ACIA6C_15995 [Streptomyces sp. NPDC051578]|uniref:terpene synthase family protein n=1 Tax=Streptomyces sp. NPDC051578 TaxID=3365662 RepID=UPI003790A6FE